MARMTIYPRPGPAQPDNLHPIARKSASNDRMTAYLLADHLLNFMAPAAFVALGLVLLSRLFAGFFRSKRPVVRGVWAQIAIIFIVNLLLLGAGLVIFGNDGKMASYAALVLGSGLCQWFLAGSWKS